MTTAKLILAYLCIALLFISVGYLMSKMPIIVQNEEPKDKSAFKRTRFCYVLGGIVTTLAGILICEVSAAFKFTADVCAGIITILAIGVIAAAIVIGIRRKELFAVSDLKNECRSKSEKILILISMITVVAQIAAVMIFSMKGTRPIGEIKYATAAYLSGTLGAGHPFMSCIGILARVVGMHPLSIVYLLLPVVSIPFFYETYLLLLTQIFKKNRESVYVALIVIEFLNIYGYQSEGLKCVTLLTGFFTFTAFIVHAILPATAAILIVLLGKGKKAEKNKDRPTWQNENGNETENTQTDDYQEEWDMKKHRIINARNLAIGLGAVAVLLLVMVYVLNNKINTLYDATVNLEKQINSSCSVYEFAPAGECVGYLIKGTDGTLTMIGADDEKYAKELDGFVKEHGEKIDKWYSLDEVTKE